MEFRESPSQAQLRGEIRTYLSEMMTPERKLRLLREGEGSPLFLELVRQMGRDGWLGLGWPVEYGGRGLGATEQYIFFDEAMRARAPINFVTISTVGPTLIQYGTDQQKKTFLPAILAGDVQFSIGYSEPEAGTDLASLRTIAVRDGDEYVVNGSKIFTSRAQVADYIWLAVRTDPDAPKHKGISILMVPTDQPGFSLTELPTVGGLTTTSTYYDNVRVPVENLVGRENEGWRLITSQLNHERVGMAAFSGLTARLYEDVVAWATSTPDGDGMISDAPWVRAELAAAYARLEAMRLLNWKMACKMAAGEVTAADSSAAKIFGTEASLDVFRGLLNIVGATSYLPLDSPGAFLHGDLELAAREANIKTFGGGTNEIQREIVAWAGLGMARDTGGVR